MHGITFIRKTLTLCLLFSAAWVWSFGTKEPEVVRKNPEWVLTVTAADVSALPEYRKGVGDLVARSLVQMFGSVSTRVRNTDEYAWYEDYAYTKARAEAAKKLVAKRAERDKLVYEGYPEWKYKKSLKTKDAEIETLEKDLARVTSEIPLIQEKPVFKLSEENKKGNFPAAPPAGGAYRFCITQKSDAFLRLNISDFQGRFHLTVGLYTQASEGLLYEDAVVFSSEDIQAALNEAAFRLVAAVSGAAPSAVAIQVKPEDALVLVDGSFMGFGEVTPREHPPGKITVEAYADEHEPFSAELELNSGELTEFTFAMFPLPHVSFALDTPSEHTAVYRGALYVGQMPLTLDIPFEQMEYFHVEGAGTEASVVLSGSASRSLDFKLRPSHTAEEQRLAKARRSFYSAFGRFWIALPIALVFGAMAGAEVSAYNRLSVDNESLYDSANRDMYLSAGLWGVFSLTALESVYRIFRYVGTSGESSPILIE